MKTPGALVVARVPGVIVPGVSVPVCVVKGVSETPCMKETLCASGVVTGVLTSVPACVLPGTPCVKGAPQGEETT